MKEEKKHGKTRSNEAERALLQSAYVICKSYTQCQSSQGYIDFLVNFDSF